MVSDICWASGTARSFLTEMTHIWKKRCFACHYHASIQGWSPKVQELFDCWTVYWMQSFCCALSYLIYESMLTRMIFVLRWNVDHYVRRVWHGLNFWMLFRSICGYLLYSKMMPRKWLKFASYYKMLVIGDKALLNKYYYLVGHNWFIDSAVLYIQSF